MPLITNLPAASALSTSDLLLLDTGSTTQKISVSNALASETAPGLVSAAAQTFAGIKTFAANPKIKASGQYPGFTFRNSSDVILGEIYLNKGDVTNYTSGRICFSTRSPNTPADTGTTGYGETFALPKPDEGRTTGASYDILTSKHFSFTGVKTILVPANSSVTLTLASSARAFVCSNGGNVGQRGAYVIHQGGSVKTIEAATLLTTSYSGSTVTFTSTATVQTYLDIIIFNGSVTEQ